MRDTRLQSIITRAVTRAHWLLSWTFSSIGVGGFKLNLKQVRKSSLTDEELFALAGC